MKQALLFFEGRECSSFIFPARTQKPPPIGALETQRNPVAASCAFTSSSTVQTWKLSPQPQRPFSFGLVKVKPEESAFTS